MRVGNIFVTTDNPAFAESQVELSQETVDLDKLDVKTLRAAYMERQRNFSTAPFDPDGSHLRFFPGDVTLWSGFPGAGKTTLLRQFACHLIARGQGVFVCSLEEQFEDVFVRHCSVALANAEPSEAGMQWCADLWSEKLRLWKYRPGSDDASHQKILAAIRVLARHGVRHAIIDSLMCMDVPTDNYEAQRLFAKALCDTAASSGCHVHLVAHPRKVAKDGELDLYDIGGAKEITSRVHNALFVRRNRDEESIGNPDCTPMLISIRKQRYGAGRLGDIAGWYDRRLRQFKLNNCERTPTLYLPEEAYLDDARAA